MKTKSSLFPSLILVAVLLASCAPAALTESRAAPDDIAPSPTSALNTEEVLAPTIELTATSAPPPTALPVATSRGPNLEATDPTTVSMASGGLQFVEFFEFW